MRKDLALENVIHGSKLLSALAFGPATLVEHKELHEVRRLSVRVTRGCM